MSKWVSGQHLLNSYGINGLEFFDDYVRKGLQPYNDLGRPISPSYVVDKITNIARLKEQYDEKRYSEEEVGDNELKKFDATIGHDLLVQIKNYDKWAVSVSDLDWNEFELPEMEAEAKLVFIELVGSMYHIEDIKKFFGVPEYEINKIKIIPELPKKIKLRPEQEAKIEVQRLAKEIYAKYPEFDPEIDTYGKIIERKEIQDAGGKHYQPGTVKKWISEVAPKWAKQEGIRSKKKK